MTLIFNIEYRTNWGEEVRVAGSCPELGDGQIGQAAPLHTVDGIHWSAELEVAAPEAGYLHYTYQIYRAGFPIRTEWDGVPRTLYLNGESQKVYCIVDLWKEIPEQQYYYTSAFTESLLAHNHRSSAPKSHARGILIKAYAPCIDADHCLGICGNQPYLGSWSFCPTSDS